MIFAQSSLYIFYPLVIHNTSVIHISIELMNYYELVGLRKVFTAVHRSIMYFLPSGRRSALCRSGQILSEVLQPVPCFLNPVTDYASATVLRVYATGYRVQDAENFT